MHSSIAREAPRRIMHRSTTEEQTVCASEILSVSNFPHWFPGSFELYGRSFESVPPNSYGWLASLRSDAYRNGFPISLLLFALASTVTKTESISASCRGSSQRNAQRRFTWLSTYRMPSFTGRSCADSFLPHTWN